jgi:hypothetical protein
LCVDVDELLGWPLGANAKRKGTSEKGRPTISPTHPMRSLHIRLRTNRQMMVRMLMTMMMVMAVMMVKI